LNSSFAEGIASEDNKEALLVSASTLLLPLLLPRVYPPLFTLYALYNEKEDNLYWDRLQKWNRQSDLALMNFLGVDPKFYDEEKNGSHFSGQFIIVFLGTDFLKRIFGILGAVDCLQQLSTTFSPGEKLNVIQSTFQEINKAVQTHHGAGFIWNMDDLFPVFQFVVVRSRIRHLGSEIHLIDDLIERSLHKGEIDIMFTTLKASV
jgi:amyotrophic lateral sclerosis 2 protein